MLFQCLCGFKPVFYSTHSDDEPLFDELKLNIESMVISMRPEFLQNSVSDLMVQDENVFTRIFEIAEMSDRDIIKVFKSLKVLKKMDKKLPPDIQRHQNRYPKKKARKYIKFLKTTLKSNPNSIFHYPLYIRYAYAFMELYRKEFEKNWFQYMQGFASDDDKASAFDVLIKAISKWEFHIYFERFSDNRDSLFVKFYSLLQDCMSDIIKEMIENEEQKFISRERLQEIIKKYCFDGVDGIKSMSLVISHCFMVSDKCGNNFEFCHMIFYEYFLAKYLIEKADFKMRKKYLLDKNRSEDFRHMYYGVFTMKKNILNEKFSKSISNFGGRILKIIDCMKLRDEKTINVVDNPEIFLVDIYKYLPEIQAFFYRGTIFAQEKLEKAMLSGVIDISDTGWDRICYIDALINPENVIELNLCGLRLNDLNTLEKYMNLKRLDVRNKGKDCFEYMQEVIEAIKNIVLVWLYIYTEDGALCEQLDIMIEKGKFCEENIFVDTSDYSEAYRKIYQLKQQAKQAGRIFRFYVNKRTNLQNAQLEYKKKNAEKDHDLLKAVFEIEADEEGVLGLDKDDAEATFWNGLSLAEYYSYQDYTDEDEKAYQIYCRLEPFIRKDGSRLSAFYGKLFGKNLKHVDRNEKSKEWLTYVISLEKRKYFSDEEVIEIKLFLYSTLLHCKEKNLMEYREELKTRIKKLLDYQQNWRCVDFLRCNCATIINDWKKGEEMPECLEEHIREFWKAAEIYAESNKYYDYLFSAVHYALNVANRMEKIGESAKLLEKLENVMLKANEDTRDRVRQGHWIQYHEQKLYYLFLSKQNAEAIIVSDELLKYPYRTKAKRENDYLYIRGVCTQNEREDDFDKHTLWNSIWY